MSAAAVATAPVLSVRDLTVDVVRGRRAWPVIADERVRGREITLGAGEHGVALAVDADEALRTLGATVADISDPGTGAGYS